MTHIRFLSFNIHGGRNLFGKRDVRKVRMLMDRLDIDVGVFQEMETRPSRGGTKAHLEMLTGEARPHHLIGESLIEGSGWYGNLIVSRFPITRGLVHNLETTPDLEPRNAVDALLETPLGPMRVIGTHLSLSYLERYSEARNLIRLMHDVEEEADIAQNPLFLMGDMNEWQWRAKLLRYLKTIMTPLPCGPTFPAFLPFLRLDRVWYDLPEGSPFHVYAHRLSGSGFRIMSDHLPLVVDVDAKT